MPWCIKKKAIMLGRCPGVKEPLAAILRIWQVVSMVGYSFLHAGWEVLTRTVFFKLVWFFRYHFLKELFKIISPKDGYINTHYMYLFIFIIYILHSIKLYIFTTWLYYIYV